MTLIDRYILREWLSILGLVLVATLGLLVMHVLYDKLEDLIQIGAGLGEVAGFLLVNLPGFIAAVLPLCLLVSLLYALGRMHHANELTALRAAGLGLFRITRGLWAAGIVFCVVVWWLNASVVPWSVEESRRLEETLQLRRQLEGRPADEVGALRALTFENGSENRLWFINRYSQFTRRAYGVTISERTPSGVETRRWLAREAWRDEAGVWILRDGRELVFDGATGEVVRTQAFADRASPGFREDPALMQVYDAKPDTLSLFELRRVIEHHRETGSPKLRAYELRHASVLAEGLMPIVILAFAIPFAVAGVRVNPAVGVSKALGLFVLYFVAVRLGLVLGARGGLPPLLAAVLPHVGLLAAGAWAWTRVR